MKQSVASTGLPRYDNPPVNEVVCGVQFKPLTNFLIAHYGELWRRFKPEYNQCEETAPLAPMTERFGQLPPTNVQPPPEPFLPRIWFVHKDGSGVVQVQRDRFLHNWRKAEGEYPHYERVIKLFKDRYETFLTFLNDNDIGTAEPLQYEMTYINHLPQSEGWATLNEFSKVFPDFPWSTDDPWKPGRKRFLPNPDGRNLRLNFTFPDESGRLHVTIRNAVHLTDNRPVLLLELTVRGIGAQKSVETMEGWFDVAHDWIVRGFADLCGKEMQDNVWRRTR